MPDFTDRLPHRWWVLVPEAHNLTTCAHCGANLNVDYTVPMEDDHPLCAVCAGKALVNIPMTPTYLKWLHDGDPRWWSPWMCNCSFCDAQGALDA